jgi:hypothetical protein
LSIFSGIIKVISKSFNAFLMCFVKKYYVQNYYGDDYMKKIIVVFLMFLLIGAVSFANNGNGPGDGIPDGPDDGAGYGSPGTGNGEGPGGGKLDNESLSEEFESLENQVENEEKQPFGWLRKIMEMFQNMFKRMLSQLTT